MEKDKKDGSRKERFIHFLDRQGFYVVLFICICVIGITALYTTKGKNEQEKNKGQYNMVEYDGREPIVDNDIYMRGLYSDLYSDDGLVDGRVDGEDGEEASTGDSVEIKVEDVLTDDKEGDESKEEEEKPVEKPAEEPEAKPVTNPQTEEKPISGTVSKITMLHPVQGNAIICDYAQDELVYSATLKEWRTHPGIDIESALGSEVKAALDGTVKSIEEDPLMGITITLEHDGGIYTKYANLSTKEMVGEGQKIAKGQVISGVGRTATAEILDAPHLHFEVIVDGKHVDPKTFFE